MRIGQPFLVSAKWAIWAWVVISAASPADSRGQVLDKQRQLDRQTFWDNRDWNWYAEHIPFFECPDDDITTTYYYRWELLTKHLTYGSPNSGYSFTEFIDRPFWSGAYGAISCPAGHQLYEARWLRSPRVARDYVRYWYRHPGAEPRRYSTWLADATWAVHQVHPDPQFLVDLLPDMIRNYEAWEASHYSADVGLFWQTGHDDGMEFNINSRQTQDLVRGGPGYRPTLNSYLFADASAIARVARLAGQVDVAARYEAKAQQLKQNLQRRLWDPQREFFFHMFMRDESRDGTLVRAMTLTHQSGPFAGSNHGRELIGFVPWQFRLPDAGYEGAWRFLMDRDYFLADFGPTTVERHDPMFHLSPTCCWWSGQSWPYATTQTLKAMANLLQGYRQDVVRREDYVALLRIFARTHRKNGRPYLAEACHPDTGSWEGHDSYNHSEHYFHSGFCDLVITGLVGLQPSDENAFEVHSLAPPSWDYFALDDVVYHGRRLSILWDKSGNRYGFGAGLHVLLDGRPRAHGTDLRPLRVEWPAVDPMPSHALTTEVNWAVNNDGTYYPRYSSSCTADGTLLGKAFDGNYWYHEHPPNRWTTVGSSAERDWIEVDFGVARPVHSVKLYLLDDEQTVVAPKHVELEYKSQGAWLPLAITSRQPEQPVGHRANVFRFPETGMTGLRVHLTHGEHGRSGLTELEAWGPARLPVAEAPMPDGNLAFNPGDRAFPKASASHTSRYDKVERAIDGRIVYSPSPNNRWTSYESPDDTDWYAIDFGAPRRFARVELAIYDDHGGVQAPLRYDVEYWDGEAWRPVEHAERSPAQPMGGVINTIRFTPVEASRMRVVFTHRGPAKSGLTELLVWEQ